MEEIKYPQALSTLRRFSANYVKNERQADIGMYCNPQHNQTFFSYLQWICVAGLIQVICLLYKENIGSKANQAWRLDRNNR